MEESGTYISELPGEIDWKERALNSEDLLREVTNTFSVFGLSPCDQRLILIDKINQYLLQK
jgi:hypothetical protein